ncbi:MAG TPA: transglutaminase domain-containing protein [Bacteroidota bacterium]|nr:transglutaminase domain-containing protein [Bacteroidota bacterium]
MHIRLAMRIILTAAIGEVFAASASAQDPPIEWGKVLTEDLALKVYAPDSSADALILADYGQASINDELGVDYDRQLRVKIFKESAFNTWGTHVISVWTGDHDERLDKLEGVTYSLGSDGQIVARELSDEGIFKEKANENITRYRLTMPALTPGCIVDVHYRIKQKDASVMPSWKFQYTIPSRWSEYRVTYPKQMVYAVVTTSFVHFSIDEETEVSHRYYGSTASYIGSGSGLVYCRLYRLAMRDLPALKEEPYITTMDDYIPKVQLQLAAWAHPGGGVEQVMRTWENVVEDLLKFKSFGRRLDPDGTIRDLSAKVAGGSPTPLAKMTALYDYVRTSVVWDKSHGILCKTDLDDVVTAKRGDAAEINFLLMALLAGAGIETHPIVLSTRENGAITDVYPLVDQFNAVIAEANVGGTIYYLDATDQDRPFDMLPPAVLNVRGLLVAPGPLRWVTLSSAQRAIRRAVASVTLDSDGTIKGTLESIDESYSALGHRHELKDKKPVEVARTLFNAATTGLVIDSASVTGRDSITGPVHITAHLAPSPYAQAGGEFLYVNPVVIDRLTANPFKRQTRAFPVDMAYAQSMTTLSVIHIPGDYVVQELPPLASARVGNSDAVYTRVVLQEGDSIKTLSRLIVNTTQFPSKSYASLKDFYDKIVSSDAGVIVLKRKPPPAPSPDSKKSSTSRSTKRAKK